MKSYATSASFPVPNKIKKRATTTESRVGCNRKENSFSEVSNAVWVCWKAMTQTKTLKEVASNKDHNNDN